MANTSFITLWGNEEIRLTLLVHIDNTSLCALRLVSSKCYENTNESLFVRTRMTFTPSAFTRASRLEALSRIGPNIKHLTFAMPHTSSTFLPPLINPVSGKEMTFLYTPHTTVTSVLSRPKYGGDLIGDVLTQQYPPIFHAATNVPAFIRSLGKMPNLRHLTISCPGQDPAQRYRRNAIDYALTSLRIALEHAPLKNLDKLSLDIHPGGLLYLRHMFGFGSTPSAGRRWKQIRKLDITMDSWDFYGTQPGIDHLKILDDYIRSFSTTLEKIKFTWNGLKGPCPLMLNTDPLLKKKKTKLFAEVTSPMSPLPAPPPRPNIQFPKLRYLQIRNATMSAPQVAEFVDAHHHTVREFDFENVALAKQGTWEEALAPLSRISGCDKWSYPHQISSENEKSLQDRQIQVDIETRHLSDSDDFARFVFEDNEVIDTLEELRRQSLHQTQTKVNTKRLKRKRRRKQKETLFGELPPPALPQELHPANRPRVIRSSQFFHPYPPPPPPPQPQFLPSPTTPTPASRFPILPPLQTELPGSAPLEIFTHTDCRQEPSFEILKPSIFDPFQNLSSSSRTNAQSPSPPRTPPELSASASTSTLTLTPTISNSPKTPLTPRLASPIHFHHYHQVEIPHPLQLHPAPPVYAPNPDIKGNQRNLHAEASRQLLSDDTAKRISVLAKARECVLTRLGKEFGTAWKGGGGGEKERKEQEVEVEKDGFWSRFYGGGRSGETAVVVNRERKREREMTSNGRSGGGGYGYWDDAILDRNEPKGNDRGKGKTELVPLMFSRY